MNPRTAFADALLARQIARRYIAKMGMEHDSPEALKDYLKEHPGADKSKHTVKKDEGEEKGDGKGGKDEGEAVTIGGKSFKPSQLADLRHEVYEAGQKTLGEGHKWGQHPNVDKAWYAFGAVLDEIKYAGKGGHDIPPKEAAKLAEKLNKAHAKLEAEVKKSKGGKAKAPESKAHKDLSSLLERAKKDFGDNADVQKAIKAVEKLQKSETERGEFDEDTAKVLHENLNNVVKKHEKGEGKAPKDKGTTVQKATSFLEKNKDRLHADDRAYLEKLQSKVEKGDASPEELDELIADAESIVKRTKPVRDLINKNGLHGKDGDELEDFKKRKPDTGKKLTDQQLMQKFLREASPETKERMKGMSVADFKAMYNSIMDEEGEGTAKSAALRVASRFIESAKPKTTKLPKGGPKVRVYDNGGKTTDRYTVVIDDPAWDESASPGMKSMLGLSEGGRAFSQFTDGREGPHLGKGVNFDDLDDATQKHIIFRLTEEGEG